MRRKLWFFGDSFCEFEDNWILQLQKNLGNPTIANLGIGGSSITFLLHDILNKLTYIRKNDYVVILFTDHQRHYFRGHHFNVGQTMRKEDFYDETKPQVSSEMEKTYDDFVHNLFDWNLQKRTDAIIISHIVNEIIPSIVCKNIIYLNSISSVYEEYPYFTDRIYQPKVPSLFHHFVDFVAEELRERDIDKIVYEIMKTPNHWFDSDNFYKSFWETYNPVFELIGGATDLRAKI